MWDKDQPGIKIIISRDVIFNKNIIPRMRTNNTGTSSQAESSTQEQEHIDKEYYELEVKLPHSHDTQPQSEVEHKKHNKRYCTRKSRWLDTSTRSHYYYQLTRDRERRSIKPSKSLDM